MSEITTTRDIDLALLSLELGAPLSMRADGDKRTVVTHDDSITVERLQAAVDAHVPGPPAPTPEEQIAELRALLAEATRGLSADRSAIPPDGETAAVVTYRDQRVDAPATVAFTVNGASAPADMVDGRAEVEVVSATPDDTITVTVDAMPGEVAAITVEEA